MKHYTVMLVKWANEDCQEPEKVVHYYCGQSSETINNVEEFLKKECGFLSRSQHRLKSTRNDDESTSVVSNKINYT